MDLQALKTLSDREEQLDADLREWFLTNVQPRLATCETMDELKDIWSEVTSACTTNDGTIRGLPSALTSASQK